MLIISIPIALLPAFVFSSAFSKVASLRDYFSTLVRPRGHFVWYLVALLTFPVIHFLGIVITNLLEKQPLLFNVHFTPGILTATLITFTSVFFFSGGVNEEGGWRGFAQLRLQVYRSPLVANLLLWVYLVVWHIPNDIVQYREGGYLLIRIGLYPAMIVTRSRLHAVRYKIAVDRYLAERGFPFKALVAFSGTVKDGGKDYTESNMNGFSEAQTAKTFERPEFRFLVAANKFQTGFDQPLLHTMYVDKKLGGVNAVQTLSRLNRTHLEKKGTMVLDFANEADATKEAFEPYYETTLLSEATDPNLLYEIQSRLLAFPVFTETDVEAFAKVYFDATEDAKEISQETLMRAFRYLGSFDRKRSFKNWLLQIEMNVWRRHGDRTWNEGTLRGLAARDTAPGPEDVRAGTEVREMLNACLDGLSPQERDGFSPSGYRGPEYQGDG